MPLPNHSSLSRSLKAALLSATVFGATLYGATAQAAPKVVATIKPVHSLVQSVLGDVATADILIDGSASPHGFSLKPSQARLLQDADVVFWIGEALETSLEKPLEALSDDAKVVELIEAPGIETLQFRERDGFGDDHEGHEHEHEHDDDDDHHAHGHDDDHAHPQDHAGHDHDDHDAHEHDDHGHDEHGHHHSGLDPHIWLDPDNAIAMLSAIATTLADADPENAATYVENAEKAKARLKALSETIEADLEPLEDRDFVVFHDAYHYFEHHFDVEASGSITLNPETPASAEQISDIRHTLTDDDVVCVFSEPQFPAKLVDVVREGTNVKTAELDPLGTGIENGPELYPNLLQSIAKSMKDCLSEG